MTASASSPLKIFQKASVVKWYKMLYTFQSKLEGMYFLSNIKDYM